MSSNLSVLSLSISFILFFLTSIKNNSVAIKTIIIHKNDDNNLLNNKETIFDDNIHHKIYIEKDDENINDHDDDINYNSEIVIDENHINSNENCPFKIENDQEKKYENLEHNMIFDIYDENNENSAKSSIDNNFTSTFDIKPKIETNFISKKQDLTYNIMNYKNDDNYNKKILNGIIIDKLEKRKKHLRDKFKLNNGLISKFEEKNSLKSHLVDTKKFDYLSLNKGDYHNELDKQDEFKYLQPIMMYTIDDNFDDFKKMLTNSIQLNNKIESDDNQKESNNNDDNQPDQMENRARNSLLKAASIARHLATSRMKLSTTTTTTIKPSTNSVITNFDNNDSNWSIELKETEFGIDENNSFQVGSTFLNNQNNFVENNSTNEINYPDKPKYLGFGELQKIFVNDRIQVRLNCQFDDNSIDNNLSISNVEWAKFENYYLNQNNSMDYPPFDCNDIKFVDNKENNCSIKNIKNDINTTIHPRPPIQNYFNNIKIPSYSITIHNVNETNTGIYRCSAIRNYQDGKKELVYRVVLLD